MARPSTDTVLNDIEKTNPQGASAARTALGTTPPAQGGAISSSSLTPQQTLTLTPPKPATEAAGFSGYMEANSANFQNDLNTKAEQAKADKDNSFNLFMEGLKQSEGQVSLSDAAYKNTVDPAEAELKDINNQIVAEQVSARRQKEALEKNPQGLFGSGLADELDAIDRRSIAKQADLAVIQMAKQGKYDSAKQIADRAVTAILEKQRLKNEALQFNYEENKDLFTTAEQRAFEGAQGDRNRALELEDFKLRAKFEQTIKQSDPLYQAQLTKARSEASSVSLGGTLNGKAQTTAQATIEGYAQRTTQADSIIGKIGAQFTGVGSYVGQTLPNFLKGSDRQQYEQAQRNFVNSVLRRESGAVISDEEFANARQQYFPQPGDGPEVIAQKADNRSTVISNLYQAANKTRPAMPGSIIEDDSGKRYMVGDDGETLTEI